MTKLNEISFDDWDEQNNLRSENETDFSHIVSRRAFLNGSIVLGASAFLLGTSALVPTKAQATIMSNGNKFKAVTANSHDTITVPEGFNWHVVAQWGDPLFSNVPEFDHAKRGTSASQALAFGDNNDGMDLYQVDGANVMVVNNEYTNRGVMFGYNESGLPETIEDINKSKMAHGVTIVEIAKKNGEWCIVKDSRFNKRLTPDLSLIHI